MNDRKKAVHVGTVVLETVKDHLWLSLTILAVVAGAVGAALMPPLVLGRIVDGLTAGEGLTLRPVSYTHLPDPGGARHHGDDHRRGSGASAAAHRLRSAP